MKPQVNLKQFYKELGRLLYAMALTDGKIEGKEIKALHEFVSKELAFFEPDSDSSGMNLAYYTDFEFQECIEKNISIADAHASFIKFLDAHIIDIDPVLIDKSLLAIEKVAAAYRKINKKEQALIDEIRDEIKDLVDLF